MWKSWPKTQCTCKNFKINNAYSEENINKFFYQCTIHLLSFDMDVSFTGMLRKNESLRLSRNDYESSFDSLLSTLNENTMNQRCVNVFLNELYKYLNDYYPDLMNKVFYLSQNHYN